MSITERSQQAAVTLLSGHNIDDLLDERYDRSEIEALLTDPDQISQIAANMLYNGNSIYQEFQFNGQSYALDRHEIADKLLEMEGTTGHILAFDDNVISADIMRDTNSYSSVYVAPALDVPDWRLEKSPVTNQINIILNPDLGGANRGVISEALYDVARKYIEARETDGQADPDFAFLRHRRPRIGIDYGNGVVYNRFDDSNSLTLARSLVRYNVVSPAEFEDIITEEDGQQIIDEKVIKKAEYTYDINPEAISELSDKLFNGYLDNQETIQKHEEEHKEELRKQEEKREIQE